MCYIRRMVSGTWTSRPPYIYELPEWPHFQWNRDQLAEPLASVRHRQGKLLGYMEALGFRSREEAVLRTLSADVIKSSEIEGERLDAEQVRSSIARRLGIDIGGSKQADRHVEGVVEMMLDATQKFALPLTKDRLFGWQAALFPSGFSNLRKIQTGAWRTDATGPMQVVSGPIGRERVHFEAPAARRMEREMRAFLKWFNDQSNMDPVVKAGLAHLWFVTIHPFDDGNGRIARAIADMMLARSEDSNKRFYSMSSQIREQRRSYYEILERTQKGSLDVTAWLKWFLECLGDAIDAAQTTLRTVIAAARFWQSAAGLDLNERQRLMLNRLMNGFEGKLTTSKYAKLMKCSTDTALRDVEKLLEKGILTKDAAGGRSTSYTLAEFT